jgi:phosphohistidine phosphatase
MRKAARGIANVIENVDVILTSPLIRALDTANIAAEALGAENKIEVCKELLPGASAKKLILYLAKYKNLNHIVIVGHEPDLGYLASALLGSEKSIIEFKKGALCCIELSSLPLRGAGTLLWHLQPKQLRDLK